MNIGQLISKLYHLDPNAGVLVGDVTSAEFKKLRDVEQTVDGKFILLSGAGEIVSIDVDNQPE